MYFVGYAKDRERFRPGLWRLVPPRRNRDAQNHLITIVPKAGREREAFEHLIINDPAYEDTLSVQQLRGPATGIMVNYYRGRNPKDTVRGQPVSGVIHLESCRFVPDHPGRWWSQFNSVDAAQVAFGDHSATCAHCLKCVGRHLDRVQLV